MKLAFTLTASLYMLFYPFNINMHIVKSVHNFELCTGFLGHGFKSNLKGQEGSNRGLR